MDRPVRPKDTSEQAGRQRLRIEVTGAVQGVGFRPFVHRLAVSEGLTGFVRNTAAGATVEVEGPDVAVQRFHLRLDGEIAPPARIETKRVRKLRLHGDDHFAISASSGKGNRRALVLPDLATCPGCAAELFDPGNRRNNYAFTTCAHCGPRYSLIEAIPYDRERTSMRHFTMCPACAAEYHDPASRRFHAETTACADCGPQLALWDAGGNTLARRHDALLKAAEAIRQGKIVALKGLGGFQLLADAGNEAAVANLRERKQRPSKPFALMAASLAEARRLAVISPAEERFLTSAAAPIVLLAAASPAPGVAALVAPGNPLLGIMLPSTPLHLLLLRELGRAVIATSGNRSGAPLVADEHAALQELAGMTDLFLIHDRPILRPVDDSVVRVIAGEPTVLRLARGYAPLALDDPQAGKPVIALGGQQKSAVAVAAGGRINLGAHIADMETADARAALERTAKGLSALYRLKPALVASDTHPDYFSTRLARRFGPPVHQVPHHLAHVLSGMIDNGLDGDVLGIAWDGTGRGNDGTIWGGEFLVLRGNRYARAAHLLQFRLLGGEAAVREPRRCGLGVLHEVFGAAAFTHGGYAAISAFTPVELDVLRAMLERGFNTPLTSSAGRLFDAAAAILGLCQRASFEGEAAMAVEFAAQRAVAPVQLAPIAVDDSAGVIVLDWRASLRSLVEAAEARASAPSLAKAFHVALADAMLSAACRLGIRRVLLTGGCFQNACLTEAALERLRGAGFDVYRHRRVPPNDGGLAAGQAAAALRQMTEE